jgi:hypothetical protein
MNFRNAALSSFMAIAMGVAIASVDYASAASTKKLTYEEAWTHCKAIMDREKVPNTTGASNERFMRGGACMKHYGYNL